jgi:mRNA-degrading endonuclease RelE of RelBE toxin-antitoxin system
MDPGEWRVSIRPSAAREIDALGESVRLEAIDAIIDLREDPFPAGSVPLRGYKNLYRIRFYRGQFRIVYLVADSARRVVIERVRQRGDAYAGLRDPGAPSRRV